jgi:hypothetical protein
LLNVNDAVMTFTREARRLFVGTDLFLVVAQILNEEKVKKYGNQKQKKDAMLFVRNGIKKSTEVGLDI